MVRKNVLRITCPFDSLLIGVIKGLEEWSWDRDKHVWYVKATKDALNTLRKYHFEWDGKATKFMEEE